MAPTQNATGVYCQGQRIFLHGGQQWWTLRAGRTDISAQAVAVETERLEDQPPLSTLEFVGRMTEANRASLILVVELGMVIVRCGHFVVHPAKAAVSELRRRHIIE